METIPDATLRALRFYHSFLGYLEEGTPWCINVTDKSELAIEPEFNGQLITDSKNEKIRKRLEHIIKKKVWRDNHYAPMRQALAAGFVALLLSHPHRPALLSCFGSFTPLLSRLPGSSTPLSRLPIPTLLFYPLMPALSSYLLMPALSSCFLVSVSLSRLCPLYCLFFCLFRCLFFLYPLYHLLLYPLCCLVLLLV